GYPVAVTGRLHRSRLEGHRRVLLDVEEVTGAQVRIPRGVTRVDAGHLHGRGDRGGEAVVGNVDLALELSEVAAHFAHHEVAHDERHLRVARVDLPSPRGQLLQHAGLDGRSSSHVVVVPSTLD